MSFSRSKCKIVNNTRSTLYLGQNTSKYRSQVLQFMFMHIIWAVEFQSIFESHDVNSLIECWTNQFSEITVNNFESFSLHKAVKEIQVV